jgi:hypothetical protein
MSLVKVFASILLHQMHQSVKVSMKRGRGDELSSFSASCIEYHLTFETVSSEVFCGNAGITERINIIERMDFLIDLILTVYSDAKI